jgi:aspartyl-tRNA(Asn)/glutamyl-tRNA(Gln) amidotransferase subunit A
VQIILQKMYRDSNPALHELTATQALRLMRAGELSPVTLVEALLERIALHDARLRAWVCVDRDGALTAARSAERAWRDGTAASLCGIPIGVKDLIFTRGLPTGANFPPFHDRDPGADATCIARLRSAGAIVLGKVETTQFAGRAPSRARNPWNLERTASGSSSGSAVAVAARMVPLSVGTQTGGSIIRPAAYLGVVGLSPTYDRISRDGLLPRSFSFDTVGAMGRSVEDVELMFSVMAGPDPRDTTTLLAPQQRPSHSGSDRAPRLVVIEDFLQRVAPGTSAHFTATIERFAARGARVRQARLPVALDVLLAIHTVILFVEAATYQSELLPHYREHYMPGLRAQLEIGNAIPAHAYLKAQRFRRRLRARFETLLHDVDALALPSMPDGAPDRSTIGPHFCQVPWTVMGWPSITLPSGLSSEGLPLGVQLVGAPFAEPSLLSAARWAERQLERMPAPDSVALARASNTGAR